MKITNDIIYVGVNDHEIDLFEGQYIVPNGMAYNSYLIMDSKCARVQRTCSSAMDACLYCPMARERAPEPR